MTDFLDALHWLIWGFVFGYFWHPAWTVCQKIWSEAKKAKEEWRNPQ
jgi:D-alanyl-lipoteichoic acid acyltransferase DltB (MBOAT superfamily)